jgi:hypothetical protein
MLVISVPSAEIVQNAQTSTGFAQRPSHLSHCCSSTRHSQYQALIPLALRSSTNHPKHNMDECFQHPTTTSPAGSG